MAVGASRLIFTADVYLEALVASVPKIAGLVIASLNKYSLCFHKSLGNGSACLFVNARKGGARNVHALGRLFLGQSLVVGKPNGFVFLEQQYNRFQLRHRNAKGFKTFHNGRVVDGSFLLGPWHLLLMSLFWVDGPFVQPHKFINYNEQMFITAFFLMKKRWLLLFRFANLVWRWLWGRHRKWFSLT
jgi:hypothetical protein